jgi:peptidyl-prolyl cis-trans isomerase SurA
MSRPAVVLLAATLLAGPSLRAERIDGVAVVVNGDIITLSEVEERVGPSLPPAGAQGETAR